MPSVIVPSVLWHSWLRQEGHPACKKTEWWDAGVVMCLGQGADLHMAQLMPLPLTISCSSKSTLVLPFWCRLTWVVLDKIQEGCKTVVCVCYNDETHAVSHSNMSIARFKCIT